VLTDFIRTGTYDRRRPLHKTISPSMDILVSSNLERLLYLMSEDTQLVAGLMKQLNTEGFYQVPESLQNAIRAEFWGGCCDDEKTKKIIGEVFRKTGYLCDTHTAAGWAVAEEYQEKTGDQTPMVVLSTASPYKFPAAVLASLEENDDPDEFNKMERLCELTGVKIPENLASVRTKKELHTEVIAKEQMLSKILYL
jgi:threonine synthase